MPPDVITEVLCAQCLDVKFESADVFEGYRGEVPPCDVCGNTTRILREIVVDE